MGGSRWMASLFRIPWSADELPGLRISFAKIPAKKTRCQSCGEFIFVRDGRLMTAQQIEQERTARIRANDIQYLGFSVEQFQARDKALIDEAGHRPAFVDVIISLVEDMEAELKALDDDISKFQKLHSLYLSTADILRREGRDQRPMRRLGHLFNAMLMQKIGFEKLAFFAPEGSCEQCVNLSGRIYSAGEMIRFIMSLSGDDTGLCCCYINEAEKP